MMDCKDVRSEILELLRRLAALCTPKSREDGK